LIPNILTSFRIIFIPFVIALLYFDQFLWAVFLFFILSITDFFDGYLARKLNAVSDFGKLMDPIADKILVISVLMLLVEKGIAPSVPVIIITAREIFISGWRAHVGSSGKIIAASMSGKVKTVLQILAVIMIMLNLPFAILVLWISVLASLYSGAEYIGRTQTV